MESLPWINAESTPRQNQRIRLFYLDEQFLSGQLARLVKKSRPTRLMRIPSEIDMNLVRSVRNLPSVRTAVEKNEEPLMTDGKQSEPAASSPQIAVERTEDSPSMNESWYRLALNPPSLFEAVERMERVTPVRKKIPLKISLADAHHLGMGGKFVPLQPMQFREQQPLSLTSAHTPGSADEDLKQRSKRFKQAKIDLDEWMSSDAGRSARTRAAARDTDFPSFSASPSLSPVPIEEIKTEQLTMLSIVTEPWEDPDILGDRRLLKEEWEERFIWDYTARKVAAKWREIRVTGKNDPRLLKYGLCTRPRKWGHRLKGRWTMSRDGRGKETLRRLEHRVGFGPEGTQIKMDAGSCWEGIIQNERVLIITEPIPAIMI
jgi:hypothetical protein